MKSRKITDLDCQKARDFFMEERSYVNFDLPKYFDFSDVLSWADKIIGDEELSVVCKKKNIKNRKKQDWPKFYEDVNCTILSNKDGAFAWRPLQIIHPVLYVDLINILTGERNWKEIIKQLDSFGNNSYIECISVPRVSQNTVQDSHKASQVIYWWEEMEQKSIQMALKYNYVFSTDIINCYGSLYTHAINWALTIGGKDQAKKDICKNTKSLGSLIDEKIRGMNYGQTNGIPQGSNVMDFIAEIVLGYGDVLLTDKIKKLNIESRDFYIIRYRDDYRIFVNDPIIGHKILQQISSALYEIGMRINPGKTVQDGDVIMSSVKPEKLQRIEIAPAKQYYQKEALRIYQLSKKYPNSGILLKELSIYYDRVQKEDVFPHVNIEVMVSIFIMISVHSPKTINWTAAIISKFLEMIKNKSTKQKIIKLMYEKFETISYAGFVEVWLQRISSPLGVNIQYKGILAKVAAHDLKNSQMWESSWLMDKYVKELDNIRISNLKDVVKQKTLEPVITREEVELFKIGYD